MEFSVVELKVVNMSQRTVKGRSEGSGNAVPLLLLYVS